MTSAELSVVRQVNNTPDVFRSSPIDIAIASWLDAKSKHSNSKETATAYRETLADFRAALQANGCDLDSEPRIIAMSAQAWAGANKPRAKSKRTSLEVKPVANGTFNQRLAIISSFYIYARKQLLVGGDAPKDGRWVAHENPIERVERRLVTEYQKAKALPPEKTRKLKAISKSSELTDKRDYVLLRIGLATGRRASELAELRQGDIYISAGLVTLTWKRTKGGKTASNQLDKDLSACLIDYLASIDVNFMARPKDAPVWISFSDRNHGKQIGVQTISDICKRHLGESKVHALRHTFAKAMYESGAKIPEIQAKLGHSSVATTQRYMTTFDSSTNPYDDAMAKLMGFDD